MLRTVVLSGVAGLVIAVDWLRFEDPRSGSDRPFVLIVLAIAPALVRPWWARLCAVAVSAFFAVCVAFSVAPQHVGRAGERFGRGFLDFYDYRLPFDPVQLTRMHQVVLLAIFAFTLAVAVAVAARRAILAVVAFLVGAGWPATLLAGGSELGRGVVILAVVLLLLAGLTERPSRLALGAAAVVIFGAFALSSAAAVAKPAFLDWQHWDFYTRPQKAVAVRYVWDANYNGVRFPKKVTTVLSIRAPRRPMYWRATVLDRFDGTRWREHLSRLVDPSVLLPRGVNNRSQWVEQDVTVRALRDNHLVGASMPVAYNISEPAVEEGDGVVTVVDGLHRDQRYSVWSYGPRPTPAQLVRVSATYPSALTKPGRELELVGRVTAPPFASPGREQRMFGLLTGRLQPYAELYDRARAVAGQTRSPYAAAVALERWFRVTGGFTYSEQPGTTPGLPPLVSFVVETRAGYCQHFAGAMALMLRLLGIPARVAAGFVPGHYHDGTWTVTDHDAHTWVEAWFPRYGWLAFDPTPGRGRLSGSYSSTSVDFNPSAAAKLLASVVKGGEVFGAGAPAVIGHDDRIRTPRSAADVPVRGLRVPPPPAASRAPSLVLFLLLLAAGVGAAIVLLKLGRRKARYLTRDPRRVASACAQELAEFLQDQRVPSSEAATLHELGDTVAERFGVDADAFTRAATIARYGPRPEAGTAARRARVELRELKRKLRRGIFVLDRVRGLVSVRSLGLS
jgi:transglutaminase-like putative cysteine protease